MKKTALLFSCFISLFLSGILSCSLFDWTPPKEDPCYKKITGKTVTYDELEGDPDLYLFVYNTGDKTVSYKDYGDILKTHYHNRAAADEDLHFDFESLEHFDEDFSNYTCGLSLTTVRKAGRNFQIKKIPARTATIDENSPADDTPDAEIEDNSDSENTTNDEAPEDESTDDAETEDEADDENTDEDTTEDEPTDDAETEDEADDKNTDEDKNTTDDEDDGEDDDTEEQEEYNRALYKKAARLGDDIDFYTICTDDYGVEGIALINAVCVYTNDVCQIFVEDGRYNENGKYCKKSYYAEDASIESYIQSNNNDYNTIRVTRNGVKLIAESFEKIYRPEQTVLGNADLDFIRNKDSNIIETSEKITILISNLGMMENGNVTLGYFYPDDLRCDCDDYGLIEIDEETSFYTNQRLMFTLNTFGFSENFGGDNAIISTLAHEFNHMLNFINKTIKNARNGMLVYETWFTEMLSLTAEDFIADIADIPNTVQDARLPYFMRWPYRGMIDWQSSDDTSYSYGFAYAFGAYLVRNYGGVKLLNSIATNSYRTGKDSIEHGILIAGKGVSDYESLLTNFGLVYINTDGKKYTTDDYDNVKFYPTLNKEIIEKFKNYTYRFSAINLDYYNCRLEGEDISKFKLYYSNPKWIANTRGPCFYNEPPDNIYAGGFYASYLGKASDYDYELNFNTIYNRDLQAYIFADY